MHLSPNAAVATPEVIGVLAWWGVLLAAPLFLLRRIRRHRRVERRSDFRGSVIDDHADVTASPGDAAVERPALPAGAEARSQAARLGATAARLAPETLEPLCRYVDFRRRLELAVAELERRLAALPRDRWRIEPYPLTGERTEHAAGPRRDGRVRDRRHLRAGPLGRRRHREHVGREDPATPARLRGPGPSGDLPSVHLAGAPRSGTGPTSTAIGSAPGWSAATP